MTIPYKFLEGTSPKNNRGYPILFEAYFHALPIGLLKLWHQSDKGVNIKNFFSI